MGEMIQFAADATEGELEGYLACAEDPKGAVIVLPEWWGLNDQIKETCDRFAQAGFTALSPDLYDGRVAQEADEADHLMTGLDWVGATHSDVRGAAQYLEAETGLPVAVMGFCMGGALTIIAAVDVPEIKAVVCYYGIPPIEQADPAKMQVPFQGHFAGIDDWCTPEAVKDLEEQTKSNSGPVEIHMYEGKEHAFFNTMSNRFDKDAAELSWTRTVEFLSHHL